MRGCEIGEQSDLQDGEDSLVGFDTRNAHVDEQDRRQDDDEWRNWRADKPSLTVSMNGMKTMDLLTPSNQSNSCGKESHRCAPLCDRDAVYAQVVTMGRASLSSALSIFVKAPTDHVAKERHVEEHLLLVESGCRRMRAQTETAKVPKNRATQDTQARKEERLSGWRKEDPPRIRDSVK